MDHLQLSITESLMDIIVLSEEDFNESQDLIVEVDLKKKNSLEERTALIKKGSNSDESLLIKKKSSKAENSKVFDSDEIQQIVKILNKSDTFIPSQAQMMRLYNMFEVSDLKTEVMTTSLKKLEAD